MGSLRTRCRRVWRHPDILSRPSLHIPKAWSTPIGLAATNKLASVSFGRESPSADRVLATSRERERMRILLLRPSTCSEPKVGSKSCPYCGALHYFEFANRRRRSSGRQRCLACGRDLLSWYGSRFYCGFRLQLEPENPGQRPHPSWQRPSRIGPNCEQGYEDDLGRTSGV
jgi:hypothetical protein